MLERGGGAAGGARICVLDFIAFFMAITTHNETHTNNCECRIGLFKWWLKKHRGVSK